MTLNIHKPTVLSKEAVLAHNKKQELPEFALREVAKAIKEAAEESVAKLIRKGLEDPETYYDPQIAAIKLSKCEECLLEIEYVVTNPQGEVLKYALELDDYEGFDDLGDICSFEEFDEDEFPEFECVYLNPDAFPVYSELYQKVGLKRPRSE